VSLARIQGALAAVFAAIDDLTAIGEELPHPGRTTVKARITSVRCTLGEFSVFRVHIGLDDPWSHDLTALTQLDVNLRDGYRIRRACVLDGHTVELMLL
jgi:hypothetical protein